MESGSDSICLHGGFFLGGFCFCRAETERGLSRKHIIEGKSQSFGLLDQMLRLQQNKLILSIFSRFVLRGNHMLVLENLHGFGGSGVASETFGHTIT